MTNTNWVIKATSYSVAPHQIICSMKYKKKCIALSMLMYMLCSDWTVFCFIIYACFALYHLIHLET